MGFTKLTDSNGGGGATEITGSVSIDDQPIEITGSIGINRTGPVPTPLYRYLDSNGDGTGNKNFIANYSSSAEIAFIQPPSSQVYRLTRMIVLIGGPSQRIKTDTYGSADELLVGINVRTQNDSGTITELVDNITIKNNAQWAGVCYDSEIFTTTANTTGYVKVRWTFERSGYPLRLVGDNNERLEVVLNDDFDGTPDALTVHRFLVEGYIE
jgi:hypothetical protein